MYPDETAASLIWVYSVCLIGYLGVTIQNSADTKAILRGNQSLQC